MIDQLALILINKNVNVEVQSINKSKDQTIIVFKLSDFRVETLSIVEEFLNDKKVNIKEIQFFSSSE